MGELYTREVVEATHGDGVGELYMEVVEATHGDGVGELYTEVVETMHGDGVGEGRTYGVQGRGLCTRVVGVGEDCPWLSAFVPAKLSSISRCRLIKTSSGTPRLDISSMTWWLRKTDWARDP